MQGVSLTSQQARLRCRVQQNTGTASLPGSRVAGPSALPGTANSHRRGAAAACPRASPRRRSLTATAGGAFCVARPRAGGVLRVRGRNLSESEHVKLGASHTLELEPNRPFTLYKAAWDALDLDRVEQATNPQLSADLAAVLVTVSRPEPPARVSRLTCRMPLGTPVLGALRSLTRRGSPGGAFQLCCATAPAAAAGGRRRRCGALGGPVALPAFPSPNLAAPHGARACCEGGACLGAAAAC